MDATAIANLRYCDSPPLAPGLPQRNGLAKERRSGVASVVPRGRALFWQGEQLDQNIEVAQGVVRAVRLLENGNRQILAFFWPGDVVRPAQAACQHYTAEAVTTCRVIRSNAASGICSQREPCGAHQVLEEMLSLAVILGQKNSVARIAGFLLRVRHHLPPDPRRPNAFLLLLPRADIADHLGASLETVCRTLAELKARGLIDLPTRKTIRFVDLKGLAQLAES